MINGSFDNAINNGRICERDAKERASIINNAFNDMTLSYKKRCISMLLCSCIC